MFTSGNDDDHLVGSLGHYPEDRSENKGNEPEGVEYGAFGDHRFLFVGSERSSVVSVYGLSDDNTPSLRQVLPAGVAPEGLLAIPDRNLLVVASEADARGDKFRSSLSIYELGSEKSTYPTVVSMDRDDATPIPWGALSALAGDLEDEDRAWTGYDSFYKESRIFELALDSDVSYLGAAPAVITKDIVLRDENGIFKDLLDEIVEAREMENPDVPEEEEEEEEQPEEDPENPEEPEEEEDPFDPSALLNEDGTVNLDLEGLAVRDGGGLLGRIGGHWNGGR